MKRNDGNLDPINVAVPVMVKGKIAKRLAWMVLPSACDDDWCYRSVGQGAKREQSWCSADDRIHPIIEVGGVPPAVSETSV